MLRSMACTLAGVRFDHAAARGTRALVSDNTIFRALENFGFSM
jgi:hypothetical protein